MHLLGRFRLQRLIALLLAVFTIGLLAENQTAPQTVASKESMLRRQKIICGFIHKTTTFITWPENAGMEDKSKPFIIGIFGAPSLFANLKKTISNWKIKNKTVQVIAISTLEEITQCHALFIGKGRENSLEKILKISSKHSLLTLGDSEEFAARGVHINFFWQKIQPGAPPGEPQDRICFEINRTALQKASLKVDIRLYKVACRVITR